MKGRRHTPEHVVRKLREADKLLGEGFELPDVLKELEVSEATYHRWRAQFGGMKADDVKRLKELEAENAKLKRIVADQMLDIEGLKELSRGTFEPGASTPSCSRVAGPARDVGASGVPAGRAASLDAAHEPVVPGDDAALWAELRRISRERPRWGYRRAHALLLADGWALNVRRTKRVWREEGLRVPQKRRKRQRLGDSTVPAQRLRAEAPDHVWAIDFQFDQTADGHNLKLLHVVDEFTREALDRVSPPDRRRQNRQRA